MAEFPKLYKKNTQGGIQEWAVRTEGDQILAAHGKLDGKITEGNRTAKPKNVGRSNETTGEQQAALEAESKWKKKKDEGYFESLADAESLVVVLPMLAQTFTDRKHKVIYPAIGQRKYNGIRCVMKNENGIIRPTSRKGKMFPHMDHIVEDIEKLVKPISFNFMPDGELFSSTLSFEEVNGLVKKEKLKPGDREKLLQIHYQVYDSVILDDPGLGFLKRYTVAEQLLQKFGGKYMEMVENVLLQKEQDVYAYHDIFFKEGYEGIMIRNADGRYGLNARVVDLQKYKLFFDAEFEIIGFEECEGKDTGTVKWICKAPDGAQRKSFTSRPKGTHAKRTEWFQNGDSYIGKLATVRYQEMTKYGVPGFNRTVAIRDYE